MHFEPTIDRCIEFKISSASLLDRRPHNKGSRSNCQTPLYCRGQPVRVVESPDYAVKLSTTAFVSTPLGTDAPRRPPPSSALVNRRVLLSRQPPPSFSAPLNDRVNSGKAAQKARSQSTLGGGGAKEEGEKRRRRRSLGSRRPREKRKWAILASKQPPR